MRLMGWEMCVRVGGMEMIESGRDVIGSGSPKNGRGVKFGQK